MTHPTHTDDGERKMLRDQIIGFQRFSVQEWENPAGRNVDMIKLAYKFADELLARDKAQRRALDLKAEMRGRADEWLRLDKVVDFTKKRHKAVYKLQLPLAYVQTRTKELKDALHQLTMDEQRNG